MKKNLSLSLSLYMYTYMYIYSERICIFIYIYIYVCICNWMCNKQGIGARLVITRCRKDGNRSLSLSMIQIPLSICIQRGGERCRIVKESLPICRCRTDRDSRSISLCLSLCIQVYVYICIYRWITNMKRDVEQLGNVQLFLSPCLSRSLCFFMFYACRMKSESSRQEV